MSKKKHRHKVEQCDCPNCRNKNNKGTNNPFGINPAQLMGLLGGMDMSQIGNMLSSMNRDGFDLNNLNLGAMQNILGGNNNNSGMNQGGFDVSSLQNIMSKVGSGAGLNFNNLDFGPLQNMMGGNNNQEKSNENKANEKNNNKISDDYDSLSIDENIEFLRNIRSIVDPKRADFIDKVIEAYNNGSFR
ncbi:hypothetical protein [Clostridium chauvoei]|uniref:Uncharacterized protein n=2 Tax=Clostridium chauvoei TaxID=46867 RepID=S6EMD7_9CLOT|nr:hypothetical protein [Clostridium chauvoei]ATD55660.1 hypothetical protein BTM20_10595 [Clostridium chauvoei]ATD56663.1 hypothetical protein BTM21_02425 [Clostridium chauvoei]MBX7280102.1 hypothetical protein [Clostridium chauvoei]MBX7282586.1 hypothetical protein [Clostridium chauvoei]MBX7284993.1 hypothetical protein [Clostridium chauvoei]